MSIHEIGIRLHRAGTDMLPQVADGTMTDVEAQLRAWLRTSGLLADDVTVLEPGEQP